MSSLRPSRSITFDPQLTPNDTSRSSSNSSPEIETPHGPIQRAVLNGVPVSSQSSVINSLDESYWPSGWRPYAALVGCFFLMFNSWGLVNTYGTFSSYYNQHLMPDKPILLLNLIGSTESSVVLLLSIVVGRLLDAGHFRKLMIAGTFFTSLSIFLLSVVNKNGGYKEGNYGAIWVTQGLGQGLGMACFFVSSSQIASTWFKKSKGFAIGVVASGASIGGLIYPMMAKFLITEIGFNNSVRCVAAVVTATCLISVVLARPNPAHQIREPQKWLDVRVFVDTDAFRNVPFMWFCAAISVLFFGFYAVFFNLEEWAAAEGLGYKDEVPGGLAISLSNEVDDDAIRVFWLLCIMNASSTMGRLGSSYLCDHLGALNVHAGVTLISSLLVFFLWPFSHTVDLAIAFVVCFGVFSGAVIGLPPASVAYILGPHQQDKLGQWTGMMYCCAAPFALTGPVIAGYLKTRFDTFITIQMWCGTTLLLSSVCMGIAIYYRQKEQKLEREAAGMRDMSRMSSGQSSSANILKSRAESLNEKEDV